MSASEQFVRRWSTCQKRADEILAEGLFFLSSQPYLSYSEVQSNKPGVYLISLNGVAHYIGEGKNLRLRLKQQFHSEKSTFYKNFCESSSSPCDIKEFQVQFVEIAFGRKELEEFGMVNAKTPLNKFHGGKRLLREKATRFHSWQQAQAVSTQILEEGEEILMHQSSASWESAKIPCQPGIYAVQAHDFDKLLYIGESSDLDKRIHSAHGKSTYFSALRRHVATELLRFKLQSRNGRKKYLSIDEDSEISSFLQACQLRVLPIAIGRLELEEMLIRKHRPILNRKGN